MQELWPLQGAAIHGLGMGGPQRVPWGGGPGGVTAEDPTPGSHIILSHRIEPRQEKVKRKTEARRKGGKRGPHTPAAPSPHPPAKV